MNYYYNPVRLYWDKHCIVNMKENIDELNAKKVLLITWSETALNNRAGKELQEVQKVLETPLYRLIKKGAGWFVHF